VGQKLTQPFLTKYSENVQLCPSPDRLMGKARIVERLKTETLKIVTLNALRKNLNRLTFKKCLSPAKQVALRQIKPLNPTKTAYFLKSLDILQLFFV
jgi:hypothetical protein